MSEVQVRSLAPDEVPAATAVFLESIADLARRNGLPPPTGYTQSTVEPVYRHLRDTGIFEVAEVDGRIVSICSAVMRGDVWFLAMFWTLPAVQLHGVGRPLLAHVQARGRELGARVFCTWSSIDFGAVAMYVRQGMLPRGPIFKLAGRPLRLPEVAPDTVTTPLDTAATAAFETTLRDVSRPQDHAYWAARGMQSFSVQANRRRLGFFYLDGGAIGPAAWEDEAAAAPVLACALREAAARSEIVQLVALGMNTHALRMGLDAGLRIVSASHLLSSAPLGGLERYVPSGPALF